MKDIDFSNVENISEILAVLVAGEENYTYIDKLANAPSADLAMFYLREAMRDFHSILRQGKVKNKKALKLYERVKKKLYEAAKDEKRVFDFLNNTITKIYENCRDDPRKLRETCSLIGAKALAIAASYIGNEDNSSSSQGGEK